MQCVVRVLKYVVYGLFVSAFLILLLTLLINGNLKSIDLKFAKFEFTGAPMDRLCFPMWRVDELNTQDVILNKATAHNGDLLGSWHIDGSDGVGGTLLSYKFQSEGRISDVKFLSCSGCGGHFWLCPNSRCGNRPDIAHSTNGDWIAYADTDGAPATDTTYRVRYIQTKPKCLW